MWGLLRIAGPKTRIVLMFVFGVASIAFGVATVNGGTDVMCGNDVMSPGDICKNVTDGTTRTYDQLKSSHNSTGLILLGAGAVFLIVGLGLILRYRRRSGVTRGR